MTTFLGHLTRAVLVIAFAMNGLGFHSVDKASDGSGLICSTSGLPVSKAARSTVETLINLLEGDSDPDPSEEAHCLDCLLVHAGLLSESVVSDRSFAGLKLQHIVSVGYRGGATVRGPPVGANAPPQLV